MSFRIGYCNPDAETIAAFRQSGLDIVPLTAPWNDGEETVRQLAGLDCWVNCGQDCTAEMIERLSGSLKMICRNGIGFDQIDIAAAERLGICVTNTAGSMNASVAEAALILILEAMRKTYLFNRRLVNGANFDRSGIVGSDLEGKTVGLIGFGGIARSLARYLLGFDCKILVYDVFRDEAAAKQYGAEYVSLKELAAKSDVVSVHCPLNENTHHLVNGEFLAGMKPSAVLVNTARGPIVDERALIEALKNGVIAGAGLDVYEQEPPARDNELLAMDNVYALPHVGSFSVESRSLTTKFAIDNILDFVEGRIPRNCLNRNYTNAKKG